MPTTTEFSLPYPASGDAANVPLDMNELATAVEIAMNVLVPPGSIVATGRATAPTGWLLCDGSAVSRSTYARLFTAIGTTYGTGNGTTTFNVPDLRGRTPVGVDGSAGRLAANDALGNTGGTETTTLTAAQSGTASHTHAISDPGHDHERGDNILNVTVGGSGPTAIDRDPNPATAGGNQTSSDTTGITVTAHAGASAASAHTNLQPYVITQWIVRI